MVQEIQPESSGYTLDVLKNQLRPRDAIETTPGEDEYVVSDTVVPNSPCREPNPDVVSECGLSQLLSSIHSDDETEHDAFLVQMCVEEVENAEYAAPQKHLLTRSRGRPGNRTLRRTRTSKQAGKALPHRGILMLMSCDKAFQDPGSLRTPKPTDNGSPCSLNGRSQLLSE